VDLCDCSQDTVVEAGTGASLRSADRLTALGFSESWRKQIRRDGSGGSSARGHGQARAEIWIAPVPSLIRHFNADEVLSPDEIHEFRQVRAPSARDSTMAGRMLLRIALSHGVRGGVAPQDWLLCTLPSGKLEIGPGFPQRYFSVSHTERIAVVALSEHLPVGIDAESIEQSVEREVAANFCCAGEQASLNTLPLRHSMRELIRLWTLKEAYAKLIGIGAAVDFASLGFSFDSLRLTHGSACDNELQAHFETMFVSNGNGLSHVSLAIGMSPFAALHAELQVITLVNDAVPSALDVPCFPLSEAPHAEQVLR
jgi:phosphopantetheinyl transferase